MNSETKCLLREQVKEILRVQDPENHPLYSSDRKQPFRAFLYDSGTVIRMPRK